MNLPTEQEALKSSWENNLFFNLKKWRKRRGNKKGIKITQPTPSHMHKKKSLKIKILGAELLN